MKADVPDGDVSRSVSLLISMLVRYPELGTINFDPRDGVLRFSFLLTRVVPKKEFNAVRERLTESIESYAFLDGFEPATLSVTSTTFDDFNVIEITRDVATLTLEEISMIIEIFREHFDGLLVAETNDALLEEDLRMQEEIIEEMLSDLRTYRPEKNLFAFREEGRVLVFNK